MIPLRKLLRLSPLELSNLLATVFLLYGLELRLRLRPLESLERSLQARTWRARAKGYCPPPTTEEMGALARRVRIADEHAFPRPSCLRKAAGLAWLLGGRGVETALRIGVAKAADQLLAHAWLDVDGPSPGRFFEEREFATLGAQGRCAR